VLVLYDMLNIGTVKRPRFSRNFMTDAANIEEAIVAIIRQSNSRGFQPLNIVFNLCA
jgi:ketopantoate hydroxymethyltransferase